jgi:hypothetical protein
VPHFAPDSKPFSGLKTGDKFKMQPARRDGLYLLLLGCLTFVMLGAAFENDSSDQMVDFKGLYYSARCLIQHGDPYNKSEVLRIYQAEGGSRPSDNAKQRQVTTQDPYPPSVFIVSLPISLLPWGPAHILWMALTAGCILVAAFLVWTLGANDAPIISGGLVGLLLANSEPLLITGNAAGIVISLCVIAVWCFLRERFVLLGILCLAISLAVKPHDTGLVWLFFLLAGGVYRKRALQTLLATVSLSLPALLWVWHVSPHWMREMQSNILAFSVHGGINDPGPASIGGHGLDMIVDLQVAISFFRDDPRFYNAVSYLVCALLLLVWMFVTLRSRPTPARAGLALAVIAPLTLLPFYHRQVDVLLLLLTVPACAMLWAEGGRIGRLAMLLNAAGLVLTGFFMWFFFNGLIGNLHLPATPLWGKIVIGLQALPTPLVLLALSVFFLWVYARRPSSSAVSAPPRSLAES